MLQTESPVRCNYPQIRSSGACGQAPPLLHAPASRDCSYPSALRADKYTSAGDQYLGMLACYVEQAQRGSGRLFLGMRGPERRCACRM